MDLRGELYGEIFEPLKDPAFFQHFSFGLLREEIGGNHKPVSSGQLPIRDYQLSLFAHIPHSLQSPMASTDNELGPLDATENLMKHAGQIVGYHRS